MRPIYTHGRNTWLSRAATVASVLLLAASLAMPALARGPRHAPQQLPTVEQVQQHMAERLEAALDAAEVTEEQRARIQALVDEAMPAIMAKHQEVWAAAQAMRAQREAGTRPSAEAREAKHAIMDEVRALRHDLMEQAASVLTAEQQEAFWQALRQGRGGKGGPRGKGGPGGGFGSGDGQGHGPGPGECPHGSDGFDSDDDIP